MSDAADRVSISCRARSALGVRVSRVFETEISLSNSPGHLRLVAAASLFRVPRCLKATLLLVDAGLSLEANTVCRTLLELAIRSCWMGTDEERASLAWNRFVRDQQWGFIRLGEFTKQMGALTKEQRKVLEAMPAAGGVKSCADQSIDTHEFPANKLASTLYYMHYDSLSAGAHGDLRDAVTIVQWQAEVEMAAQALEVATFAAVTLLCATSLQLGFRNELEVFLSAHGLPSAFRSSRPAPDVPTPAAAR